MSSAQDDGSDAADAAAAVVGEHDRHDRVATATASDEAPARVASPPGDDVGSSGAQDLTGRTIGGRYTLEGLLGTGAIGHTYRARRTSDGQQVALKLLHPKLRTDETFKRRLHRDVEAASKLEHLHIARTFEQGSDELEGPFLCREFIEGDDLVTALRHGALTPRRVCELMIQVLSALSEAQRHGVLHQNLKPHNVLVTRDGSGREFCKVCDFGNPQRVRPGAEYMAPEQAEGQAVDGQADVYSVGVILYELLSGEVPFHGRTPEDTLALIRTQQAEPPRERRPGHPLPRELETVCMKALVRDPRQRHRSPREMSQALRAVVSLLGLRADEPLGSTSFGEGGGIIAETASADRMTMPGEQMRSHTKFWLGTALLAGVCVAVLLNPVVEPTPLSPQATQALGGTRENGQLALADGARLLRDGDAKSATILLRNARRALGDSPEVLRALGEALIITGDHDEGSQLLAHYLELEPGAPDRAFVLSLLRRAGQAP
jgi:hypothetical protein